MVISQPKLKFPSPFLSQTQRCLPTPPAWPAGSSPRPVPGRSRPRSGSRDSCWIPTNSKHFIFTKTFVQHLPMDSTCVIPSPNTTASASACSWRPRKSLSDPTNVGIQGIRPLSGGGGGDGGDGRGDGEPRTESWLGVLLCRCCGDGGAGGGGGGRRMR